ncbi:glycosyltransferase family 4 protein [bacterium]|nr:glycosyltransferase family 4 protein [bacterium]
MKNRIGFITERMILGFGVDLVIHNVAKGLIKKGYQVTVYTSISDGTYNNEEYKLRLIPTPTYSTAPLFELSALRWLKCLKKEKIDLFFIESFPFFPFLVFLNPPRIAVFHGTCSTLGFPLKKKLNFWYMDGSQKYLYYRFADRVVAVSHYLKSILPQNIQKKTGVIHNGADHYTANLKSATIQNFRRSLGILKENILLLYVGRINPKEQPYKGTAKLVEMYKKLRKKDQRIKLLLAGYGDAQDKAWLKREGVLAYLKVPVGKMGLLYSACDIYVTVSQWEGFDLPLLEAQYFGKPAVAYKIGAHPEVVANEKSGFLINSPDDFINSILTLARNKKLRNRMGRNALKQAARFSWTKTIEKYQHLLEEMLN